MGVSILSPKREVRVVSSFLHLDRVSTKTFISETVCIRRDDLCGTNFRPMGK